MGLGWGGDSGRAPHLGRHSEGIPSEGTQMVAVETTASFDARRRRHEGLELASRRTVGRPERLGCQVRVAGGRKLSPVADHGFGEFLLVG